jgi:hypothetical protein
MIGEYYNTAEFDDTGMEYAQNGAEYDGGEVDDMLDALMESGGADDLSERRRQRNRQRSRAKGVQTAQGRSAYREPGAAAPGGPVTQKQFKEALDRVGADVRRNAEGIKAINTRLNTLDGRVDGVVTVATKHSRELVRLQQQMKVDGALELVESLNPTSGTLDVYQLLKGAVKLGFLGDGKGPLSNPAVIGGAGLLLRNPGILGGLFAPRT